MGRPTQIIWRCQQEHESSAGKAKLVGSNILGSLLVIHHQCGKELLTRETSCVNSIHHVGVNQRVEHSVHV